MANINASIKLGSGFLLKGAPTDLKLTAATIEERNSYVTANALYKGAIVYVEEDNKYYKFTGNQPVADDFSSCFEDFFAHVAGSNVTVNLTGDQTIDGTKTFNTAPKIGSETVTTKEYVDGAIQTGVTDAIGSTIQAHDDDLDKISALDTEGYLYRGSDGTYNTRSVTAKDASVTVETAETGTTISLPVSGVTANSYGPTESTTVDFGGTIAIPQVTFDDRGRATTAATQTITLPAKPTDITGNAETATKLAAPQNFSVTGKATAAEVAFDGSGPVVLNVTSVSADAAEIATKLATAQNFSIGGKVTASEVSFDGSGAVVLNATAVSADTADKLSAARNITLTGAVTGTASFDGSAEASIETTLSNFDASKITSGIIDIARLPKGALERLVVVQDVAALLLLTADDVQEGDTIKIVEASTINEESYPENCLFFVTDGSVFDGSQSEEEVAGAITVYTAGSAASVPWSGVTGKPEQFKPEAHVHATTDITSGILPIERGGTGNAEGKAAALVTPQNFSVTGKATAAEVSFDGTGPVVLNVTSVSADTATTLATPQNFSISGKVTAAEVSFDGSGAVVLNATAVAADTAEKLAAAQNITLTGDVTGTASFDGSAEASIAATLKNSGVAADTYGQETPATPAFGETFTVPHFTVDAKGIVTAAGEVTVTLPDASTASQVLQTVSSDNENYAILAKNNSGVETVTDSAKFAAAVTVNPSTGTINSTAIHTTGNITADGDITGARVWNAVWNDYAEFFPRGEKTEEGDIIMLDHTNEKEQYVKAVKNGSEFIRVVGVHSESFGHIIGGELPVGGKDMYTSNIKKYIPIGLTGRVPCKVVGQVFKGAKIVPSDIPGVGRVYDEKIDSIDDVVGYLVEADNRTDTRLLKIKI